MWDKLAQIAQRCEAIEAQIATLEVVADPKQLEKLARERASIEDVVARYREYRTTLNTLEETRAMLAERLDDEMRALVKQEIEVLGTRLARLEEELKMDVKGRDLVAGLPKTVSITSEEIREAMAEPIAQILEAVRITLERTPPEISSDLIDKGIVLAGGGSLLRGIDKLISEETGLPVHLAEDPMTAVALGTGKVLSEMKYLKMLTASPRTER